MPSGAPPTWRSRARRARCSAPRTRESGAKKRARMRSANCFTATRTTFPSLKSSLLSIRSRRRPMPNSDPVSSNVKIGDHSVMFEGSERYAKAPVAAKSVVTGNPDPTPPKESLAKRRESDPIVRYAPLVYLHPEEEFFTATCEFFINNSELKWRHDSGCPSCRIAKKGEVNASKLGSGGYKHRTRTSPKHLPPCAHTGDEYASN